MEMLLSKAAMLARCSGGTYFPVELMALSEELGLNSVPQEVGMLRKSRRAACGPPPLMVKLTGRHPGVYARAIGCTDIRVQLGGHSSEEAGDQALNMSSRAPMLKAMEEGSSDGESCFKSYILGKIRSFSFFKEQKILVPGMQWKLELVRRTQIQKGNGCYCERPLRLSLRGRMGCAYKIYILDKSRCDLIELRYN